MGTQRYKKQVMTLVALLMLIMLSACGAGKQTVHEDNMSITLTKDFSKATLKNATWYYRSSDALVMGIKTYKTDLEKGGMEGDSAMDYAVAYIKANEIPGTPEVKTADKYVYFEYSDKISKTEYSYLTCIYENVDCYWMVNFACYKDAYAASSKDFFKWADSVKFDNE